MKPWSLLPLLCLSVVPTRVPTSKPQVVYGGDSGCQYDEQCGSGMCKVWEHNRFVCEPQQYGVAVWDRECLERIELGRESTMEAPLRSDGTPDMERAHITHTPVTFTKECGTKKFRIEIRKR